jgi:hypothetical protein
MKYTRSAVPFISKNRDSEAETELWICKEYTSPGKILLSLRAHIVIDRTSKTVDDDQISSIVINSGNIPQEMRRAGARVVFCLYFMPATPTAIRVGTDFLPSGDSGFFHLYHEIDVGCLTIACAEKKNIRVSLLDRTTPVDYEIPLDSMEMETTRPSLVPLPTYLPTSGCEWSGNSGDPEFYVSMEEIDSVVEGYLKRFCESSPSGAPAPAPEIDPRLDRMAQMTMIGVIGRHGGKEWKAVLVLGYIAMYKQYIRTDPTFVVRMAVRFPAYAECNNEPSFLLTLETEIEALFLKAETVRNTKNTTVCPALQIAFKRWQDTFLSQETRLPDDLSRLRLTENNK